MTTVTLRYRIRWWQLWKRFQQWRHHRALNGSILEIRSADGIVHRRMIVDNTATAITVSHAWDALPEGTYTYRIHDSRSYTIPELNRPLPRKAPND